MPKLLFPAPSGGAAFSRRSLIRGSAAMGAALAAGRPLVAAAQGTVAAPAIVTSDKMRPQLPSGVQAGDVLGDRAMLWARADRPARMSVRWSTVESMKNARELPFLNVLADTDFAGKLDVDGLPAGQTIFYEVVFTDFADLKTSSEPVKGSFKTPPAGRRDIKFVWSGDMVGQGWGINPDAGGIKIYKTMLEAEPDFFIHSGDTIYADGPLSAEVKLPDGTIWKNVVTEAKSKAAESLAEYRGAHAYNLLDENVRAFNARTASFIQWDDHEVTNNWFWEKRLDTNKLYKNETRVSVLAPQAMNAFFDYYPVRRHPLDPQRIYQNFGYGPSLEVMRIDMRPYRGRNDTDGLQTEMSPETRCLGEAQIRWLKQRLLASNATWKVIACDMPIGLCVWNDAANKKGIEAWANGDNGAPKGRELELADILRFIRDNDIKNTVWLTADVHYTAAHYYDPNKAAFQDFLPFWEFVTGPLNAGTFGPNELDNTFGPQVVFVKAPPEGQQNLSPAAGMQFFGEVTIDGGSEVMTVRLKDMKGATLFTKELEPSV